MQAQPAESTSRIVQQLKQRSAVRILGILRQNNRNAWCRQMLVRLRLPATVHDQAKFRVWQRRFYPLGIYSEKKRLEKLSYLHGNPVKQGLVNSPDQWPWSSFRLYHLNEESILRSPCRMTSPQGSQTRRGLFWLAVRERVCASLRDY